jgi:hypothetical protein
MLPLSTGSLSNSVERLGAPVRALLLLLPRTGALVGVPDPGSAPVCRTAPCVSTTRAMLVGGPAAASRRELLALLRTLPLRPTVLEPAAPRPKGAASREPRVLGLDVLRCRSSLVMSQLPLKKSPRRWRPETREVCEMLRVDERPSESAERRGEAARCGCESLLVRPCRLSMRWSDVVCGD